ncbi:MAG TPA: MFS transporter [Gaiellaceae bacterium]|nr:MFS transporter [Gaiellaceae bacterium]
MTALSRQLLPLRNKAFRLLALATLGSSIGTLLAAVALAIDIKDRTNSGYWVGAVLVVAWLPTLLVGLTLGPLIDRLERRKLMIGADLVRAAVFAALPFTSRPTTIVALAAVAGLASGFFRPAVYAGIPNLVPEDQLAVANGLLQAMENISWAIGPILGGVLAAAAGPHAAYWLNAVSFVFSAILIARIPARLLQSKTALSRGHWRDLRDGFSVVAHSRALLAVLFAWGIASLGFGASNVSEVFLAKNVFHSGDWGYGLIYGATGIGLIVGSAFSSLALARFGSARTYGRALLLMAIGLAGAAASPDIWLASVCCIVSGCGNGAAVACNYLLVQQGTTDDVRGRALTVVMSATLVLSAAAYGIGGALLNVTSARWIWAGSAGACAIGAVVGYLIARTPRPVRVTVEPAH